MALLGPKSGTAQTEAWHPACSILLFHSWPTLCPASQAFSGPGLGLQHPAPGPSLQVHVSHHGCISLVSTSLPLELMVAAPALCLFGRAGNPFPFPLSLLICGGLR